MALSQMKGSPKDEQALMTELWDEQVADDLEQFVLFTYPWGKEGTPLERFKGPRSWQRDELARMTDHIKTQKAKMQIGLDPEMWRSATASGRGPGKSAIISWLVHWMMTTRVGSTSIITANTEPQLKSRTFAEIGKWTTLAINGHWFDRTVLSIRPAEWFKQQVEDQLKIDCGYYYAQGQLWSEETPDAFAGAHNPLGIFVGFDESSGIPNSIFEVTEGFFTEPELNRFWCIYSNPRRNSGGFFDVFHTHHQYWHLRHIDSRTVEGTDKARFEQQIAQYGIDSDMVRKEILGQFPKQGDKQFISNVLVHAAQTRTVEPDHHAPLIMGVDVARFGDDASVLRFRQGRDAKSIAPQRYKNRDNMFLANEIARWIDLLHPDAVNIDAGNGTGVIDRLREMKYRVNEIWFGGKADSPEWANKRTEMYAELREWLNGGAIDADATLFSDLTSADYTYFGKAQDQIILESKELVKEKIGRSPDDGDALALTFAKRVARRDNKLSRASSRSRVAQGIDDSVFT
jgi:hypothetical protein